MRNLLLSLIVLPGLVSGGDDGARKPEASREEARPATEDQSGSLGMSKAVVCRFINGYEDYEVLPGASLTAEEKLVIYYRPLNYSSLHEGAEYRAHLLQDGQIRRAGEKRVLRSKKNILDYAPKSREPLGLIFLKNAVPLKGLTPGDYEYDILLRDEHRPGPVARQSVRFKILAPVSPGDAKAKKERARKGPPRTKRARGRQSEPPLPFDADIDWGELLEP